MGNKLMAFILVLTLSMTPFTVNNSFAGGGGGCTGEDAGTCWAVVGGITAATLIILTVWAVTETKTETSEGQPSGKESLPANFTIDPVETKPVTASTHHIKDRIAPNGNIIILKW